MRVLHVTSEYPPHYFGGLGTSLAALAEQQVAAGLDVHVLLLASAATQSHPYAPYTSPYAPYRSPYGAHLAVTARSLTTGTVRRGTVPVTAFDDEHRTHAVDFAVRWCPDAVHLHASWLWPAAHTVRARTGAPVVYTVHSLDGSEAAAGETIGHGTVQRDAIRGADAVVALCPEEQRVIARGFPTARDRIHVLGNGISVPADAPLRPRAHDRRKTVLFVGRFAVRKGLVDLFDAIPRVLSREPNTRFVLVGGDVGCTGRLGMAAARTVLPPAIAHLGDAIEFRGWVDHSEIGRHYDEADVFVVPSRYEPFGMVVLEAMARALPVVATSTGGPSDIIANGETGLLFTAGDPAGLASTLALLLGDADLRVRMGDAGRRAVARDRSWNPVVARLRELYAGKPRRGASESTTEP